jgi:hypothetical protein
MPQVLKMGTPQHRSWCVVLSAKEEFCNSCATCISHAIAHGTTQSDIHFPLMQEIQALRVRLQKRWSWSAVCVWGNCGPCSALLQLSLQNSTCRASRKWQLPQTAVSKILRKRLLLKPYELQLLRAPKVDVLAVRYDSCREILYRI